MKIPIRKYFRLLSKYLKPQKFKIILLAFILAGSVTLQLINPQIIRYFIDEATEGSSSKMLTIAALMFLGAAIMQQVLAIASTYVGQKIGWSATNALRIDLIEHCLNLDMIFHKNHKQGEIIERIDGDVTALFDFFSSLILKILNNMVLLIGILILLFREDFRVGASLSIFIFVTIVTVLKIHSKAVGCWIKLRKTSADLYGFIGEEIGSTEDVRSSGAADYVMYRYYDFIRKLLPIERKAGMMFYRLWASTLFNFAVGNAIAFAVAGYLRSKGLISIGAVYLIFHYTNLLNRPIDQLRWQLEDLQKAEASINRIEELFNTKSNLIEGEKNFVASEALSVKVKNINFQYEKGIPVLNNISLNLSEGKVLGILGRTGSGKTTLARLLVRFYDPCDGEIYFSNQKIDSVSLSELRKNIAYVTQEVQLFHATVRDNITFFNKDIKDEEIIKMIHEIGLEQWYTSLPKGLDTMLDAEGSGLSAGEAQLLSFVRVFLKNPGLVILDEASSRLDPATEKLMEIALNKLLQNRTCIIIAHRLDTVQRADHILILDNGSILEYGERKELIKDEDSKFYNLLQTGIEEVLI